MQPGTSLCLLLRRRLRCSPRVFVQVAICCVFIYYFLLFAPKSLPHGKYERLLAWKGHMNPSITRPTEDVRVIVFGSQDVMGSAVSDTDSTRTSWTLQLCKLVSLKIENHV